MADNRKALLGLLALSIIVIIIFYVPRFFESGIPKVCIQDGVCEHEEYLNALITYLPAILVLGFLIGIAASYFYFERKIELPLPSPDRAHNVLLLLNPTERKIISQIIADKGQSLQSDISRIEGIGKVKAHRTIDKLIRRGVIEKEEKGKTNILKLKKEIKDALDA
jgi:hypothetical protein